MLVILLTALVFINIVKYGNKLAINMEGFAEGLTTNDETDETSLSSTDNTLNTKNSDIDTTSLLDKMSSINK
jgi:hypothetical protein